jgi:glycosyltransferase involved in cell wall biosynthesis
MAGTNPETASSEWVEESPLVSVVVPTYNRRQMLEKAVDSVLAQTYHPIELIVVDDGSTDNTRELLAAYGSRLICLNQSRAGVSAARNAGIVRASGRWIALLDSDDYWLPEKIAHQIDYCRSTADVRICQTEEIWIRNGRRVNPRVRHKKAGGMIFEQSLPLCLVSPSAVMLHREIFDEVGLFDESLPACEDYDLWLRITWKYPVHLIDEALTVKRGGHEDQLSRRPELDKYRIAALVKILRAGVLSTTQQAAAVAVLDEKCRIYANGCEKRGRIEQACYYHGLAGNWRC